MKMGLRCALRGWGYHVLALVIGLMFISGMGGSVFALVLNAAMMFAVLIMAYNDGAYNGEKACTLAASIEKQVKEGRQVEEKLKAQVYDRKIAAWILIIGMLPLLLVSTANLIAAPFYPEPEVEEEVVEEESFQFDYSDDAAEESGPVNVANVVARLAFMPYVSVYSLVDYSTLNLLFLLFSLPIPLVQSIGYLLGPKLRAKKLHDIALGKKRKMRNLKVHKKPRQQKAEV